MVRAALPEDDDIADPIGQPIEVYRVTADLITEAVEASLTALTGIR
jgi:protein-tyrosine phosphatase